MFWSVGPIWGAIQHYINRLADILFFDRQAGIWQLHGYDASHCKPHWVLKKKNINCSFAWRQRPPMQIQNRSWPWIWSGVTQTETQALAWLSAINLETTNPNHWYIICDGATPVQQFSAFSLLSTLCWQCKILTESRQCTKYITSSRRLSPVRGDLWMFQFETWCYVKYVTHVGVRCIQCLAWNTNPD